MTEKAIRIEEGPGEQPVLMLPGDHLAPVQMAGQYEVIAGIAMGLPDSRIVRAQHADVTVHDSRTFRTGHRDDSPFICNESHAIVNPVPAAFEDDIANGIHADAAVVIAGDGEDGRDLVELPDQQTELAEFGPAVGKISAKEDGLGPGAGRGLQDLVTQHMGSTSAQMDVTDIEQPAGIALDGQSLLAHMQGMMQAEFERGRHGA